MGTIKVTSRDLLYFIFGSLATLLIGGILTIRIHEEHLKFAVKDWFETRKSEVAKLEGECHARLVTNTGRPGTIWIIFDSNSYNEQKLADIALWLAKNQCPYGISSISK